MAVMSPEKNYWAASLSPQPILWGLTEAHTNSVTHLCPPSVPCPILFTPKLQTSYSAHLHILKSYPLTKYRLSSPALPWSPKQKVEWIVLVEMDQHIYCVLVPNPQDLSHESVPHFSSQSPHLNAMLLLGI